jgi:hypothetical protein
VVEGKLFTSQWPGSKKREIWVFKLSFSLKPVKVVICQWIHPFMRSESSSGRALA